MLECLGVKVQCVEHFVDERADVHLILAVTERYLILVENHVAHQRPVAIRI